MLHFDRPLAQGCKLRHGFFPADSRAPFVVEFLDLPLDEIQRIDAPHGFVRHARLFSLRVGQGFECLEEASPRVRKTADVHQAGACTAVSLTATRANRTAALRFFTVAALPAAGVPSASIH